jgi:tetratricopeptide (TPR) repeat protein
LSQVVNKKSKSDSALKKSIDMFLHAEQVSWLTCNNDVNEAMEMVRPHMSVNPICAVHYLHATLMSLTIRTLINDTDEVEKVLNIISDAEKLVNEIESSDERVLVFAKHNMQLNARAEREPPEGYPTTEQESKIDVTKYSQTQLIAHYKIINQIMSAELNIVRGGMQFMTASYVRAVYNIRLAMKAYETLYTTTTVDTKIHPDIVACVKCGYGLFQYVLSTVPPGIQWLLNMLGFGGDRQVGLTCLREAADSEGRLSFVACLGLGAHYVIIGGGLKSRQNKLNKYEPVIRRCIEKYPHGTAFQSFAAQVFRKRGDVDAAIAAMETGLEWSRKKLNAEPKFVKSELAQNYFLVGNYDKTIELMTDVLKNDDQKREFPGRSLSAWVLAMTYSIQGRVKERNAVLDRLESYYNLTKKNMPLERFVTSKNDIIKTLTLEDEKTLFLLISYFELLYARDRLNELNNDPDRYYVPLLTLMREKRFSIQKHASKDLLAGCAFFEAVFEKRLGANFNDVKEKLYTIIDSELKIEPQWVAFANFELAEMLWNLPDRNPLAIERALKACAEVKDFPSEDILHSRLKSANRQVAAEKKKQLHHKKHHHHQK